MVTPQHKKPCPGGYEIYNFYHSLVITLSLSESYTPEYRRRIFKKYINITLFTPKLPPLWVGGHEIYNFLSPYPKDATNHIWLRLAH